MKKWVFLILAAILLTCISLVHLACVKGNPIGADISTQANTILTVIVADSNSTTLVRQSGITIQATDPSGNTFTQTTDNNGQTIFQARLAGQWTVTVPTQGNFYLSTANVNVVAGTVGPSVTFTAQGQQLILAPLTSETYGISGANISYTVTYSDSGNLAEPVSLVMAGSITQTGWTSTFNYPVLGSTTNLSQLNIIIPQGSYQQPTFTVQALRMNGTLLANTSPRAINKNYSVETSFIITGISGSTTATGNLSLSTVNAGDSTTPWVMSLSVTNVNSFSTNDGTFSSGNMDSFQLTPGTLKPVTINLNYSLCNQGINVALISGVGNIQGSATNINL